MSFKLRIETDNAAFGEDMWETTLETARILEGIAASLKAGETDGKCRDTNGNTVGEWGFSTLARPKR